jgi:hypothetical protein
MADNKQDDLIYFNITLFLSEIYPFADNLIVTGIAKNKQIQIGNNIQVPKIKLITKHKTSNILSPYGLNINLCRYNINKLSNIQQILFFK